MNEAYVPDWAIGPKQAMEVLTAAANAMSPQTLDAVVDAGDGVQPRWGPIEVISSIASPVVSVIDAVGQPFGGRYRLRTSYGSHVEYLDPIASQVVVRTTSKYSVRSWTLGIAEALAPAVVCAHESMRDRILRHTEYRKLLTPLEVSFEEVVAGVDARPFVLTAEMLERVHHDNKDILCRASRGERLSMSECRRLRMDLEGPKESRVDRLLRELREAGAVVAAEHEEAVRRVLKR